MVDGTGEDSELPTSEETGPGTSGSTRRQLIGALVGGAIAFALSAGALQLGWVEGSLTRYALWGGVVGGLVGGSDTLARAGQRLTRRDVFWLNILVALVGMVVITAVLFALANGATVILQRMMGN